MKAWDLQLLVRNIDKKAAGISARGAAVLLVLASHARIWKGHDSRNGQAVSWPSEWRMAQELGLDERSVRRAIKDLVQLGLFEYERGRQHQPSRYWFRPDKLSALPSIPLRHQTGQVVRSETTLQTGQVVQPDRTVLLPDRTVLLPDRTTCPPISPYDLSKEEREGSLHRARTRETPQSFFEEPGRETKPEPTFRQTLGRLEDPVDYIRRHCLRNGTREMYDQMLRGGVYPIYGRLGLTTEKAVDDAWKRAVELGPFTNAEYGAAERRANAR